MKKDIYIIGGGISGLYMTYLLSEYNEYNIFLYEKSKFLGGRIQTEYNDNKDVLYETGPWRIHSSHTIVLQLIKKLGLSIKKIDLKNEYINFPKKDKKKKNFKIPSTTELSEYEYRIIEDSIINIDIEQRKTGYDQIWERANKTNSYSIPDDKKENNFYIVEEGLSCIVENLYRILKKRKNVTISLNTMITDLEYKDEKYNIFMKIRKEDKWISKNMKNISILVLALPPDAIKNWKSFYFTPYLSMIESRSLCHIMAKTLSPEKINYKKFIINSPLSQVIPSLYENKWFQISYSAGRLSELFQNLSILGKNIFQKYIQFEFYKFFPKSIKITEIKKYFWRHAVHFWKPNIETSEKEMMERSVCPSRFPNLYWIGESISMKQGWIEGALGTAIYAFQLLKQEKKSKKVKLPKKYVIYDGKIINVEKWIHQHPGGEMPIENHLGEDITELWNSYHSSEMSRYFIMLEER